MIHCDVARLCNETVRRSKTNTNPSYRRRARLKQSILGAAARLREAKILARQSSTLDAELSEVVPETVVRIRTRIARPRRPRSLPSSADAGGTSSSRRSKQREEVEEENDDNEDNDKEGKEEVEEKQYKEEDESNVLQAIEHISAELQGRLMGSKGKTTKATMESWDMVSHTHSFSNLDPD